MTITITGGMTFTGGVSATVGPPVTATYLVVGGGASGGYAGGGGGGGLVAGSITLGSGSNYTVTVGAGGSPGSNGTNTTAFDFIALGGGTGGGYNTAGSNGGSGGGGGVIPIPPGTGTLSPGTSTQNSTYGYGVGYAGGTTSGTSNNYPAAGGGGAGAVGAGGSDGQSGAGGIGAISTILGTSYYWAAGGGGGAQNSATSCNAGAGGQGGAGGGAANTNVGAAGTGGLNAGTAGTAGGAGGNGGTNTGSGGGGGKAANTNGGNGGSGIVVVSYSGAPQFSGGTITSSGGNTIHTFYSSGTLISGASLMTNSLRFRSSSSAYLNRTPTATGSAQKFTWSGWIKRGKLSTTSYIYISDTSGAAIIFWVVFNSSDQLQILINGSGTSLVSNAVYRDPAAWYHIQVSVDTTQATTANRILVYVNGSQVTSFSTTNYYSLNDNIRINAPAYPSQMMAYSAGSVYTDGYLTDVNFIDGQGLSASSFGATNSTTGVWQPISYTGTYGTNGFHLPFTNTISTAALGTDTSGNNNTFTVNNISLTSGATYDSVTDVPTLTNASVSNYCVYNPLNNNGTITNGSLRFSNTAGTYASCSGTMGMSNGKYYWEVTITAYSPSGTLVGITASTEVWTGVASYIGSTAGSYGYYNGGTKYNNAASTSYGSSWTTGDVIGVTYDTSTGTLTFYKNNVSQGTAYSGLTGTFMPGVSAYNNGTPLLDVNFGQQPFVYTPPLGYVQLNAYNM